jgi:hypothetical protein
LCSQQVPYYWKHPRLLPHRFHPNRPLSADCGMVSLTRAISSSPPTLRDTSCTNDGHGGSQSGCCVDDGTTHFPTATLGVIGRRRKQRIAGSSRGAAGWWRNRAGRVKPPAVWYGSGATNLAADEGRKGEREEAGRGPTWGRR